MLSSHGGVRCVHCFDVFSAGYTNTLNPDHGVMLLDHHDDELRLLAQARPPRNYLPCALAQRGLAFSSATVTEMEVSSSATALDAVGLGHGTCRDI